MNASHSKDKPGVHSQSTDNCASNLLISNKRGRHATQRYGDTATLDLSDSLEDALNLGDDSFDDQNFVPSEGATDSSSEKILARIVKPLPMLKRTAKRSKANKTPTTSRDTNNNSKKSDPKALEVLATITTVNLDKEFDGLSNAPVEDPIMKLSHMKEAQATSHSVNTVLSSNENAACNVANTEDREKELNCRSNEDQTKTFNDINSIEGKNTHDNGIAGLLGICQKILLEFRHYAKESMARISILEEAMIKNGTLTLHRSKANEHFENSRIFTKSNRLPIANDADFNEFEKNLGDEDFKIVAVIFQINIFPSNIILQNLNFIGYTFSTG